MENWGMTSFKIAKTIVEKKPSVEEQSLPVYSGELAVQFDRYPDIDLTTNTLYFKVICSFNMQCFHMFDNFVFPRSSRICTRYFHRVCS